MSRDNAEILRLMLETGNAEGWSGQRVLDFFDPDWVGHTIPGWPGPQQYHGPAGFRELVEEWTSNFDNFRVDLVDVVKFGAGVVGLARMSGDGKQEGIPVSTPLGFVTTFRGGRLAETHYFFSWEQALEAVGL